MKTMLAGGPRLRASCAAAALAATFGFTTPADAARCRPGLIYRVSKGVCEARAGNERFLHRPRIVRHIIRTHHNTATAHIPPERPSTRDEAGGAAPDDSTQAAAPPQIGRQAQSPSPFGTLALPSLRCGPHADTICKPADLFKVE